MTVPVHRDSLPRFKQGPSTRADNASDPDHDSRRSLDTEEFEFIHELQDIETLNRRALAGELEVTAVSIHAYAYLADKYVLLPHGASMGDGYGPRLVAREPMSPADMKGRLVAIPGKLT